jgi:hypothetical protein
MLKYVCYFGTIVLCLLMLNTYAMSNIGQDAAGGSYLTALNHAFLGGYGNTMFALSALIVGIIGLGRTAIGSVTGGAAWVTGKLVGIIVFILTAFAVFGNSVMVYMKLQPAGAVYISLTGPVFFDIAVITLIIVGYFAMAKRPD